MNPSVPQSVIDEAMDKDPASARAEYLAEFRTDFEAFIEIEKIHACITAGVYERPPDRRNRYFAFVDPSGGSGQDSFCLAVAHKEAAPPDGKRRTETLVLDLVREGNRLLAPKLYAKNSPIYSENTDAQQCAAIVMQADSRPTHSASSASTTKLQTKPKASCSSIFFRKSIRR